MFGRLILAFASLLVACAGDYIDPHCNGKQVIVHLFEWKWTDVATECERFLSRKGYCGVQVSPVSEHVMVTSPMRPWWERYQPVSYKLHSRSGTESQFQDMVNRCKAVGVRIYADVVLNHMSGHGRVGKGTGGSSFNGQTYDFPAVPYSKDHFNSECPVNNYGDPNNVRDCFLVGLDDLNQRRDDVRGKISGFLNHLVGLGVAGFRVDASKHMWPADLKAIESQVQDLPEGGRPFFIHEVIDQNDGAIKTTEYTSLGYVTEFRYSQKLAWGAHDFGQLNNVVDYGWGMTDSSHALVFVDNHDNQRGHGGGGNVVTHKTPTDYRRAVAFMLANDYGFTRVMSSYYFGDNTDQGPPHNADWSAKDVPINSDGTCGNGWVCEHRWKSIANMVAFRNAVAGTTKQHWHNTGGEVAFSRGSKGFFAMSKTGHMDAVLQTGLPAGQYCDLITDCAKKVTVDGSGMAHIVINNEQEPVLAFIVGDSVPIKTDTAQSGTTTPIPVPASSTIPAPGPPLPVFSGLQRTVILIEKTTQRGQDLFVRGGLDHSRTNGCTTDATASACAIPIRHRSIGTGSHYDPVNAWSVGDNYLDWYGAEAGQGSYHGQSASGTPAVWTTNAVGRPGYNSLNTYGDHYWLVDVDMDCSHTMEGWFELKAVVNGAWEGDMSGQHCAGAGNPPTPSSNHWAKCGVMNVFHFGTDRNCEIKTIP